MSDTHHNLGKLVPEHKIILHFATATDDGGGRGDIW